MPIRKEDTQRALSILESILCQFDAAEDDGDFEDLHRIRSAVDMMRSPLFSALVDIRNRQSATKNSISNGGAEVQEVKVDAHRPEDLAQFRERYDLPKERLTSNGAVTNGNASTDSTHLDSYEAKVAEGSGFKLKPTFASGDLEWNGDVSVPGMDYSPKTNCLSKKMTTPTQPVVSKGGRRRRRNGGENSSPLLGGGKDGKPKSSKKISLGWKKGSGKSKNKVTLADLAHSVPSYSANGGMESPRMRNGDLDNVGWAGRRNVELELGDTTPDSRKSYDQEEESSLSELSALIDSASLQSVPLLTEAAEHLPPTGQHQSVDIAMASNDQATIIKNCDAMDSESVESDGGNPLSEAGEELVATVTIIENCGTHDGVSSSVPKNGTSDIEEERTKGEEMTTVIEEGVRKFSSNSAVERDGSLAVTPSGGKHRAEICGIDGNDHGGGHHGNSHIGDVAMAMAETGSVKRGKSMSMSFSGASSNSREEGKDQPKDILFFMRDQDSQSQIKQLFQGPYGRSRRTVSLKVCDVSLVAGGGASVGIDMVGLSSTGVFVGGVSDPSNIEGKLQSGDQILAINGRTVENMASFEVDMILSDMPVGETVELTAQYNPSGLAEYHRLQQRKRH